MARSDVAPRQSMLFDFPSTLLQHVPIHAYSRLSFPSSQSSVRRRYLPTREEVPFGRRRFFSYDILPPLLLGLDGYI